MRKACGNALLSDPNRKRSRLCPRNATPKCTWKNFTIGGRRLVKMPARWVVVVKSNIEKFRCHCFVASLFNCMPGVLIHSRSI